MQNRKTLRHRKRTTLGEFDISKYDKKLVFQKEFLAHNETTNPVDTFKIRYLQVKNVFDVTYDQPLLTKIYSVADNRQINSYKRLYTYEPNIAANFDITQDKSLYEQNNSLIYIIRLLQQKSRGIYLQGICLENTKSREATRFSCHIDDPRLLNNTETYSAFIFQVIIGNERHKISMLKNKDTIEINLNTSSFTDNEKTGVVEEIQVTIPATSKIYYHRL